MFNINTPIYCWYMYHPQQWTWIDSVIRIYTSLSRKIQPLCFHSLFLEPLENLHQSSQLTMQPRHTFKATHLADPPSYLKLIANVLFNARILIFLITIFLFLLSLCYTFGQILSVEINDFWCPRVTLSEVRTHSKNEDNNEGAHFLCWNTKRNTVNFNLFVHLTYNS